MDRKDETSRRISRMLGIPEHATSRGGTIGRPFLDEVASALDVSAPRLDKVGLLRLLLERLEQPWDPAFASAHTGSGGGGNVTLEGLEALERAIEASISNDEIRRAGVVAVNAPVDPSALAAESLQALVQDTVRREDSWFPEGLEDARHRVIQAIVIRRGQSAFRRALLRAYDGRCAISRSNATAALEAAHVVPYLGPETNRPDNGLLLRSDVHTLFDLGLIGIKPRTRTVAVAAVLGGTEYAAFAGRELAPPSEPGMAPSLEALEWRWAHYRPAE